MWTPTWLPISFLERKKDDTYMVRVENVRGDGIGDGWIDKGYFADDSQKWTDDAKVAKVIGCIKQLDGPILTNFRS